MPNINVAFVPPNPKEFERHALIFFSLATFATKSKSFASWQGFSRLIVGGNIPSCNAFTDKIASAPPAAPSRWPVEDFVDEIDVFFTSPWKLNILCRKNIHF